LWIGCFSWVVGTLWSAESATYSTGIWIPAYFLIVCRDAFASRSVTELRKTILRNVSWLLLPLFLLGASIAMLAAYYLLSLGHAPDFHAFFEVAMAFKSG